MKPPPWQSNEAYQKEFADLVEKHSEMMYKTARRITRNRDDARDVVQTVFIKMSQGPPPSTFIRNPGGYLRQAAYNEAVSLIRSRGQTPVVDDDIRDLEIAAPEINPHRIQKIMNVRATLKVLKPGYAEILQLAYVDELSCREISAQLGKGLQSVWVDLHRARNEFKKKYRIQEKQSEKGKYQRAAGYGVSETSEI
jgi:RNA polymerase sigma factor (sigma-70 family)